MANSEHLELSNYIKGIHKNLRNLCNNTDDPDKIWEEHLQNTESLKKYAFCMKELSKIWDKNNSEHNNIRSRIEWSINYLHEYFLNENKIIVVKRLKEIELVKKLFEDQQLIAMDNVMDLNENLNLLDVGSCFNPFKSLENVNITALDLYPENESVFKGDFLKIIPSTEITINNNEIITLPTNYYHIIIFSLLLEYIPTSRQRIKCCQKAYDFLRHEGILIICTPDSNHIGANAKLMKNWRYCLANLGFSRIKIEKLSHLTCMVFRKSLIKDLTVNWAKVHKEDYMDISLELPQNKNTDV